MCHAAGDFFSKNFTNLPLLKALRTLSLMPCLDCPPQRGRTLLQRLEKIHKNKIRINLQMAIMTLNKYLSYGHRQWESCQLFPPTSRSSWYTILYDNLRNGMPTRTACCCTTTMLCITNASTKHACILLLSRTKYSMENLSFTIIIRIINTMVSLGAQLCWYYHHTLSMHLYN